MLMLEKRADLAGAFHITTGRVTLDGRMPVFSRTEFVEVPGVQNIQHRRNLEMHTVGATATQTSTGT